MLVSCLVQSSSVLIVALSVVEHVVGISTVIIDEQKAFQLCVHHCCAVRWSTSINVHSGADYWQDQSGGGHSSSCISHRGRVQGAHRHPAEQAHCG